MSGARRVSRALVQVRTMRFESARMHAAARREELTQMHALLARLDALQDDLRMGNGPQPAAAMRQMCEMRDRLAEAARRAKARLAGIEDACIDADRQRDRAEAMMDKAVTAVRMNILHKEQQEIDRLPPRRVRHI